MTRQNSGRCLCGGVTFQFTGSVIRNGHCHCESCRRATSSPITTFFCVPTDSITFSGDTMRVYASSPGVRRGFCGQCGSPMTFETDRRPGETDLYVAALDGAEGMTIETHWHWEEHVSWLQINDDLPKQEG